jgi:hypothetical protein
MPNGNAVRCERQKNKQWQIGNIGQHLTGEKVRDPRTIGSMKKISYKEAEHTGHKVRTTTHHTVIGLTYKRINQSRQGKNPSLTVPSTIT